MSIKELSLIRTINDFSMTEKIAFYLFGFIFLSTGLGMIFGFADPLFASVPAYGGSLTEGVIGYPRYINPVLNITDSGRDISALIYAGLFKENNDGSLSPDLADTYTISSDGLTYDVYLKKDVTFHDGYPVRADDVIFTIEKAKDPALKSPEFVNWQGVNVSKIDDYHIQFTLRTAYAPFMHNLTLGILPKHIWANLNTDQFSFSSYNFEPIGSGPYQFVAIKRDADGLPISYTLSAFDKYAGGRAYIDTLALNFYKNSESALTALRTGKIESIGGLSESDLKNLNLDKEEIKTLNLLRTFAVFFNQNQSPVLLNKEVRQALDRAVDRQKIIDWVLGGYGTPSYSPIPSRLLSTSTIGSLSSDENEDARIESAKKILTDNGWSLNSAGVMEKKTSKGTTLLSFTLTTSENNELTQTADLLKEMWAKIGAQVTIEAHDATSLNQTIIRPRKYEALLFGEVVGHDVDLYPFWHSSQRNNPGLNVALYANLKADNALERERTATTTEERSGAYADFNAELAKDIPAVFLYSPQYIYVVPKKLQGFSSIEIETPRDRFEDFEKKYIEEKKVLKIFNKGNAYIENN